MENEEICGLGVVNGKLRLKEYGHVVSQYTKYVRPGSKTINAVVTGLKNVFGTACKDLNAMSLSIVFINKGTSTVDVNVSIDNISGLTNLSVIRT